MKQTILEYGPLLLGAVFTSIGAWVARAAMTRAWLRDFLARLLMERRAVVLEVEQTYVDRILHGREADSPGGAELTGQEKREALAAAVNRLADLLGLGTIERALRLLGLPVLPSFVKSWLTTHVEAAVKELSIEQVAAQSGSHKPVPPPLTAPPSPSSSAVTRQLPRPR